MAEDGNADIGHGLSNALTAIGGFADILRRNPQDDGVRRWALDGLDEAIQRAVELVGRLHASPVGDGPGG